MKKFISIAAISVVLAGCQTVLPQSAIDSQRQVPAERKAQIVRIIKKSSTQILDLHSLRDAEISDIMTVDRQKNAEIFCVKFYSRVFNVKSRKWSTDDNPVIIDFAAGKTDIHSVCRDPRIKYHPFPELENVKNL